MAQKGEIGDTPDTLFIKFDRILIIMDQVIIPKNDTTIVLPPKTKYRIRKNPYLTSERFYKSLRAKSKDKKLTKELLDRIIAGNPIQLTDSLTLFNRAQEYNYLKEKPIAEIHFGNVDMFSGNVYDTLKVSVTKAAKFMNRRHKSTMRFILQSNLFLKKGDAFNPVEMADNERILRHLPYIQDARILAIPHPNNPDAVKVIVITQDKFPWGLNPEMADITRFGPSLSHSNVLRLGQQIYAGYQSIPTIPFPM